VRLCEVLAEVRARAPGLAVTVVGEVPEPLVRRALAGGGPLQIRRVACDVGVSQRDALLIDEPATAARCLAFDQGWDARLEAEVAWLRASGARAALADVPPLPLAAARRAGLPSLALGNFSWDWIWRHLAARQPALLGPAARAAAAYGEADLILALPFAGDLSAFRRRIEVGFVARRPRVPRAEARRRLGLDPSPGARPVALVSFGGVGLPALSRAGLPDRPDLAWLLPEELPEARLDALGLGYPDVIGAVDAVVTKPGYGIVTDCLAAGTPLVYTERGDFPEYQVMVRELPGLLACVHVGNEAVRAGRLAGPVHRAIALPRPPAPDLEGGARAAAHVLAALG